MTALDTKLLPCPFCGGEAERYTIMEGDEVANVGGDVISCTKCGASSHVEFGEKANLVDAWNRRASPSQGEGPAADVVEAQIEHMVQRFLGWKLPEHFRPDGGISYEPIANKGTKFEFERTPYGTNLFDHTQATAMVRYMFDGMPAALASLAPRAAQGSPADEQSGETSHVADDSQPDEAQEWHDYDPDC